MQVHEAELVSDDDEAKFCEAGDVEESADSDQSYEYKVAANTEEGQTISKNQFPVRVWGGSTKVWYLNTPFIPHMQPQTSGKFLKFYV